MTTKQDGGNGHVDRQQLAEVLQIDAERRVRECLVAIEAACQQHDCQLVPVVEFRPEGAQYRVEVVSR